MGDIYHFTPPRESKVGHELPRPPAPGIVDIEVPPGHEGEFSVALAQYDTRALCLAEREDFYSMCQVSMWGSESTPGSQEQREFVQLLSDVLQEYQPVTRYHLSLLADIVHAVWQIRRTKIVQKSVFEANKPSPGSDLADYRLALASRYDALLDSRQDRLERAIIKYRRVVPAPYSR